MACATVGVEGMVGDVFDVPGDVVQAVVKARTITNPDAMVTGPREVRIMGAPPVRWNVGRTDSLVDTVGPFVGRPSTGPPWTARNPKTPVRLLHRDKALARYGV